MPILSCNTVYVYARSPDTCADLPCIPPSQVRIFIKDYPNTPKLLPKRNWATLRELPPNQAPPPLAMDPKDPPLQVSPLI